MFGSLIGIDDALDDNETGAREYIWPNRMAVIQERWRSQNSYGIKVLSDPAGVFTGGWFECADVCWALKYSQHLAVTYQGWIVEWRGTFQHRCEPRRGLIYRRAIYEIDADGELLLDEHGKPTLIWGKESKK